MLAFYDVNFNAKLISLLTSTPYIEDQRTGQSDTGDTLSTVLYISQGSIDSTLRNLADVLLEYTIYFEQVENLLLMRQKW